MRLRFKGEIRLQRLDRTIVVRFRVVMNVVMDVAAGLSIVASVTQLVAALGR